MILSLRRTIMTKRSIYAPTISFEETLNFVKQLNDKYPNRSMSQDDVLKILGLKNFRTNGFQKRIRAAEDLELLEKSSSKTFQISRLARQIIYPKTDNQKEINDLKIESFLKSELNSNLVDKFTNSQLPTVSMLSNILFDEFKVNVNKKDQAAQSFLDSISQLGIYENKDYHQTQTEEISNNDRTVENISLFSDFDNEKETPEIENINLDEENSDESTLELVSLDYNVNFSISNSDTHVALQIPKNMLNNKQQLLLTKKMINADIDILME